MVTVAQQHQHQHQQEDEDQENGSQNTRNHRGVTIRDICDDDSNVDCPSSSVGTSSLDDRGYGTDAICVRSDSDLRRIDQEDASHSNSTQYSDDDDDSLEGDELGLWSNDLSLPGTQLEQHFDNGVPLPISEVPTFGDVSVKNSANVHFGNKTFYNGPVTIKQIVYANPNLSEDNDVENIIDNSDNKVPKENAPPFPRNGYTDSGTTSKTKDSENPQNDHKVPQCYSWLMTWQCVALICAAGSLLVAAMIVSVVLLTRDTENVKTSSVVFPEIPISAIDGVPSKLRFVERAEWGAQPPTEPLEKLKLPVPYVIISHTATDYCKTQSECTFRVRFAQTFHIESRNWSDIAYNFLIGGDGYAYVGRGWDSVGAHSYGYNKRSLGISFIGTFNSIIPPKHQLLAAQNLIEYGIQGGKIAPDFKLLGHRQVSKTLSPGEALYSVIIKWANWSPTP